jgi:hypothetical protein
MLHTFNAVAGYPCRCSSGKEEWFVSNLRSAMIAWINKDRPLKGPAIATAEEVRLISLCE